MKEIKAYIRPNMMDPVVDAIEELPDAPGLTTTSVRGWGHPKDAGSHRLTEREKLEIVVSDDRVREVVDCILRHARTGEGHVGDGKIFITEISGAIRIRDGKKGSDIA